VTRRPDSEPRESYIRAFVRDINQTFPDDQCLRGPSLVERVRCVHDQGAQVLDRFAGVLDTTSDATYFASVVPNRFQAPFSGVALTGVTLLNRDRYFVYVFSPKTDAASLAEADRRVHQLTEALLRLNNV
jgi:hypothetical protein